jgi:anaerobic selenocysteine-containing dehydrogenase
LRVSTQIGYFVNRVWLTESIMPGVVACSHHLGRWRLHADQGSRWGSTLVRFEEHGSGTRLRQIEPLAPFESADPDSKRVWWSDGGVHQNLAFPVQPDPVSGMHCWHQHVRVEKAPSEDRYGDVFVDRQKSREVYRRWLELTRPPKGKLRRPLWMGRPVKPVRRLFDL